LQELTQLIRIKILISHFLEIFASYFQLPGGANARFVPPHADAHAVGVTGHNTLRTVPLYLNVHLGYGFFFRTSYVQVISGVFPHVIQDGI